jgi:protoporphyrinogen oxidase
MKKPSAAVIGAGFAGLAAAWDLINKGYLVTVFEAAAQPGGLASGFRQDDWQWSLEHHYHHIFQTDSDILSLIEEMGLADQAFFSDTKTRSLFDDRYWRLDSPVSLLQFQPLSFVERLRVGAVLAFLKLIPDGTFLERFVAADFLKLTMGDRAWQVLWRPLFVGKFGKQADKINMAWFWARIKARSQQLGYFRGGFLRLAEQMVTKLTELGVEFKFQTPIKKITKKNQKINLLTEKKSRQAFDAVISTLPSPLFAKLVNFKLPDLPGLGAVTLVLELDKPFFTDDTYWLNIHHLDWPFLAVVEHTNLVGGKHYGNKHLVYVGKYLPADSEFFEFDKKRILSEYRPYLEKLSPDFYQYLEESWLFKASFAQPLVFKNHAEKLPPLETAMKGLFWGSMQQVYPWDRGTNFAVRFGRKTARAAERYLTQF